MIDVLKQSALLLERLIRLLLIAKRSFDLYEVEVMDFSLPAEGPSSAASITARQASSSFGEREDAPGSDSAWHLSFLETAPVDNQLRDCTAVLQARLAKVSERILHVVPLPFSLLNALIPNR